MSSTHVVIIGAGASGTFLALHLLRKSSSVKISLIEKSGRFGPGLAYGTPHDVHLLNVRAGGMSAFENEPGDFVRWLNAQGEDFSAHDFVPRRFYGEYLSQLLQQAAQQHRQQLELIRDEVMQLDARGNVRLRSGKIIEAGRIVLAAGNFLPATPAAVSQEVRENNNYYANPWDYERFAQIGKNERVLIIGSGLTMADATLFLQARGHAGRIVSLCTHGYPPVPHGDSPAASEQAATDLLAQETLHGLFLEWRKQARKGVSTETLAGILRPHIQTLWRKFSPGERKSFLEHLRHLWGTARHRVPQQCFAVLEELQKKDRLEFLGGRIKAVRAAHGIFQVDYLPRKEKHLRTISAQHLINCTGPSGKYEQDGPIFLREALKNGTLRMDALKLGLDASAEGQLKDASGKPQEKLFATGPLLRGILWEITAVPDIRKHCESLAARFAH